MKFAHNLVLIAPLLTPEEQEQIRELSFVEEQLGDGRTVRISIMGLDDCAAGIICTIPDPELRDDGQPLFRPEESEWINSSSDHMLATLRMGWNNDADYLRFPGQGLFSASYVSDSEKPTFPLKISMRFTRPKIAANTLANSYVVTAERNLHHVMELLSESYATRLPDHYRFLALYKVIELEHPKRTPDFHSSMEAEFFPLGVSNKPLKNLLPQLRVKVAHALASGAEHPGLSANDRTLVSAVLPIMRRAIHHDIGFRYGLKFIQDDEVDDLVQQAHMGVAAVGEETNQGFAESHQTGSTQPTPHR